MLLNVIMWMATALSIVMYAPQVYKTLKSKDASSLSKITFLFIWFATGNFTLSMSSVSDGGYWANFVIMILMIPIFWYVFKSNRKWFYVVLIISIIISSSSLYLYIKKPSFNDALKYIFAINSAGILITAFWPQTILIIKSKKIESYSLTMGLTTMIANILWIVYWAQMISFDDPTIKIFTSIITLGGSISVVVSQSLVFTIYITYNQKIKD